MWVDKVLYWAWTGRDIAQSLPPTDKVIEYVTISCGAITQRIAWSVYDMAPDGVIERRTHVNQEEVSRVLRHGRIVEVSLSIDIPSPPQYEIRPTR